VYLYPPGTKDADQNYEYHLWLSGEDGPLMMKVSVPAYEGYKTKDGIKDAHPEYVLFSGEIGDFDAKDAEKVHSEKRAA
jgi:hypothetical protein